MPTFAKPLSRTIVAALTILFGAAYLGASFLDLWTTQLALADPRAAEGNPFAVVQDSYSAGRAWIYTAVVGPILLAYVCYGLANLHRVSDATLRNPLRSYVQFRSWIGLTVLLSLYFVPRSDRAALHMLSAAVAFVVLRLLAAANNAMIALWGDGFLAASMRPAISAIGSLGAFILVIGGLYVVLIVATAKLLGWTIAHHGSPMSQPSCAIARREKPATRLPVDPGTRPG